MQNLTGDRVNSYFVNHHRPGFFFSFNSQIQQSGLPCFFAELSEIDGFNLNGAGFNVFAKNIGRNKAAFA